MNPTAEEDPIDVHWMGMAIREGRQGIGLTGPNPPVGAVIVKDGKLIGSGHHRIAGGPHAEIEALKNARAAFPKLIRGATIYITLEPCSTHGRTPPCTDALIEAGLSRVVYGASDPNPQHQGRAEELLQRQRIRVTRGIMLGECQELIRPFRKWITTGMPYIIAKAGQTLDGRITRPPGEPQWITNDAARAHGRRLRQRVDAILVGAETIRRDNPRLTLRGTFSQPEKLQPWRVILSRSGDLPEDSIVFTDQFKERTFILPGMEFADVLRELATRQIASVLIEGGGIILSQAFRGGFVDEAHWYIAPRFCGGGQPSLAGPPFDRSIEMRDVKILPMGDNVLVSGYPIWPKEATP
jgi:diaminohydroxyphosphoribosylaminopyrimidine deaminase/5-amino-6-(5-phosphoribosylamino)uracil reductase